MRGGPWPKLLDFSGFLLAVSNPHPFWQASEQRLGKGRNLGEAGLGGDGWWWMVMDGGWWRNTSRTRDSECQNMPEIDRNSTAESCKKDLKIMKKVSDWKSVKIQVVQVRTPKQVELSMSTTQERLAKAKEEMHEVDLGVTLRARVLWPIWGSPWLPFKCSWKPIQPGKISPFGIFRVRWRRTLGKHALKPRDCSHLGGQWTIQMSLVNLFKNWERWKHTFGIIWIHLLILKHHTAIQW